MITLAVIALAVYLFATRKRKPSTVRYTSTWYCEFHDGAFTIDGVTMPASCPVCTATLAAMEAEFS